MLWSAFLLGLLGSFHCVGMCGPIALALPSKDPLNIIIYNLGRTATYVLLGAIMGSLGELLDFASWQQWLSITAGILIIVYVGILVGRKRLFFDRYFSKVSGRLLRWTRPLFDKGSSLSNLSIGLANGFLPCGLVYMGLVGALATGSIADGSGYMLLFGLGTIPVMLTISMTGSFMSARFRSSINRAIPAFLVIIAILFILRGMNLGIPYVSPKLTESVVSTTECVN